MRLLPASLVLLATVVLAGCGGSASDDEADKPLSLATPTAPLVSALPAGEVKGRLLRAGGAAGTPDEPLRGTVTFTAADGSVARTRVDSGGEFQISLSPGSYVLRGTSPDYLGGKVTCVAEENPTLLADGRTTTVDIVCPAR